MKPLKVSVKMAKAIEKLERKYGSLDKTFGSETIPYKEGYYCYCTLRSSVLKGLAYTVNYNGETFNI